jgi:2-haloacid dehalogenase
MSFPTTKALLFDVFGTVVDWRSTVTEHLITRAASSLSDTQKSHPSALRLRASSLTPTDWGTLAQEWRDGYMVFTRAHDPASSFISVDEHHLQSLTSLTQKWDITGLWTEAELKDITFIWHYLRPWPDSSAGLAELNKKFITSTLSNGNVSLLTDMAKFAGLPWTHILSSEHFKAYKPSPLVYNGAATKLGLQTSECALVAAHLNDLKAAKRCGYKAIYVERAQEERFSPEEVQKIKEEGWVDLWISLDEGKGGFLEVAKRLGIE